MKFSIVVPVYNKASTLPKSIDSVLKQTFKDFEILVVDDGSSDNFEEIICSYTGCDNIRVFRQTNLGVSVARNNAIEHASGDYICFLDADDIYLPNHLEVLNSLITKYNGQSFFCTSHITEFSTKLEKRSDDLLRGLEQDFLCANIFSLLNARGDGIVHTNSICVNRKVLLENGLLFEPGERIGEDTDLWFRVALLKPVVLSKKVTTVYRRQHSTATAVTTNSFSWIFAKRIESIKEMRIDERIKVDCFKLIDRYMMKCSRDKIAIGQRSEARLWLKQVKYKNKKFYLSGLLLLLPTKIAQELIRLKTRN